MEGTLQVFPSRRKKTSSTRIFTSGYNQYIFICGGAFAGLDKIISQRDKGTSIGFGAMLKIHKIRKLVNG